MKKIDYKGKIFGRWTVLRDDPRKSRNVVCRCECGVEKSVDKQNLRKGTSKSCGCLSAEITSKREKVHGKYHTRTYSAWASMVARGRGQGSNGHYYSERGIEVCERWLQVNGRGFLNFLEDMGDCPAGISLDRIDNNQGYFKENCQWANQSQQSSNRRKGKRNTSGRIGVMWRSDQELWRVSLKVQGVVHNIGNFHNFSEACSACEKAELRLLGYSRRDY